MMIVYRNWRFAFPALLLLVFSLQLPPTHSKTVSGDVKLTGQYSEAVLASFAISPYGRGWMGITLSSKDMYETENTLKGA